MKCTVRLYNTSFPSSGELLALPVFSDHLDSDVRIGKLNTLTDGRLSSALKRLHFEGKYLQKISLEAYGGYNSIVLVGLGARADFTPARLENALAEAVRWANKQRITKLDVYYDPEWNATYEEAGRIAALAGNLANYAFTKYLSKEKTEGPSYVEEIRFCLEPHGKTKDAAERLERGVRLGALTAEGMCYTRDLVNEPASAIFPETLAAEARKIAASSGGSVSARILEADECDQLGMGAYLAVGQGSDNPVKFILLSYRRANSSGYKRIALVGKSVTFDTGGYQIKPGEYMNDMKIDMTGGATMLGIFKILSKWDEQQYGQLAFDEIYGILPACENMISGRAYRPGDILTAMNGKTIEVKHTDAEGRLTLADALAYASRELKCEYAIDFATLTGAIMVALGNDIAGVFGNDEAFTAKFMEEAERAGERAWRMPLPEEYRDQIKGEISDLTNLGKKDRYGGAITAALFLQEFVDDMKWIHVDIAGASYSDDPPKGTRSKGATAWGVKTLLQVLSSSV